MTEPKLSEIMEANLTPKAISGYIKRLASELTSEHKRVLKATATRGTAVQQTADGDGKLRYELKRKGLISVTRPDPKGRFTAYRTPTGDEVVAALAPKPRARKPKVQGAAHVAA